MFKDNSTEKIKHQLKEKIHFYLNENLPKRQGFSLQPEPVEKPVRNYPEPKKKEDAGGIGGVIAQYAPMVAMMAAPSMIDAIKTKLTQKIAAKASKTINEDGPRRQGSSEQQGSAGAAFQRPQIGGGAASAGDGGGVMGTVGTIATQAPTAIMLAQMARKKAAEKAAQKIIEKGTEKVVEQGTKEVVKRGAVQAVKRVGGEAVKRVGTEVVKRVGIEAIKVGVRTAATTALQGVGASSVAAVAGTAIAGAAIGTGAAYAVNRGIDSLMGSKPGEGLADRQFEGETYNPLKIAQGIGSLGRSDEMIQRDTKIEAASAKADFEADGRGQNMRDADAEAKRITDKFDADFLAKSGTEDGLKALQNGTSANGSVTDSSKGKQEQNINFMYGADSGNVRTRGGSVNITSTQDQDYKGIDNGEQRRKFNIKVKNDAVPIAAGSDPNSPLNMMLQNQATNRQGYVKLGDVNIDSEQIQGKKYNDSSVKFDTQQASPGAASTAATTAAPIARQKGTGPSADALTDAAQESREIVTTTAAPTPAPTPAPTVAPTAAPTAAQIDPRVIKMKKDRELLAAAGKTKGVIINGVVQPD